MFYGTPKILKLQPQQQQQRLEELTMKPIISDIGTATYEIAKYLNKLLTPLSKSDYNILNTEGLVRRLREEKIPSGYKMISIDVESLLTNVPLYKTIDFILKKVYDEMKIQTNIPKTVLKELLYLWTKQFYFTFYNSIYIQYDGLAMGSTLGPLLANIFMTSLKEDLIPNFLCKWKRYVNDTHVYVESIKVELNYAN